MKNFMITTILALLSSQASALGTVSADMTAKTKILIDHHGVGKGGWDCRGGRHVYLFSEQNFEKSSELSVSKKSGKIDLLPDTGYFKARPSHGIGKDLNLFHLQVRGSVGQKGNSTTLTATVDEVMEEKSKRYDFGRDCTNNHYIETLKNADYSGKIHFSYTVPSDVWALEVSESAYNRIFTESGASKGIKGALFESKLIGKRIIWVTPGSTVSKSFNISANANSKSKTNSFSVSFKKLGSKILAEEITNSWLTSLIDGLTQASDPEQSSEARGVALKKVLNQGFTVLRSRDQFEEALSLLSTSELFELTDRLYETATGRIYANDATSENSVRTLAALISYEVASLLVEDFRPFCELTEHQLKYLKETANVSDLQWAVFMMTRMIRRLEVKDKEEGKTIMDTYSAFLKYIKDIESLGLPYNVIHFPEELKKHGLPSDLREKLKTTFATVRASANPQSRPIAKSYQDLVEFYRTYDTLGTDEELSNSILSQMDELTRMEKSFVKELMAKIRRFSRDNSESVDFTDIHQMLNEIKSGLEVVTKDMRNSTRLLSIGEGKGEDSLKEIITKLRVHSLNIVKDQYKAFDSDPNFDFELVRSHYIDPIRTTENIETVNLCLSVGGAK